MAAGYFTRLDILNLPLIGGLAIKKRKFNGCFTIDIAILFDKQLVVFVIIFIYTCIYLFLIFRGGGGGVHGLGKCVDDKFTLKVFSCF